MVGITLKNKFIVLPNVNEGGNDTILRSGFHPTYKDMPCVGGYLDGPVTQLGDGNTRILNGKDSNYGSKKLGIFQTSDNRRRDFTFLGQHSTWVKWAIQRKPCGRMPSKRIPNFSRYPFSSGYIYNFN